MGPKGLQGIRFLYDRNNDYDMRDQRLTDVKKAADNNSAVSLDQMRKELATSQKVETG